MLSPSKQLLKLIKEACNKQHEQTQQKSNAISQGQDQSKANQTKQVNKTKKTKGKKAKKE